MSKRNPPCCDDRVKVRNQSGEEIPPHSFLQAIGGETEESGDPVILVSKPDGASSAKYYVSGGDPIPDGEYAMACDPIHLVWVAVSDSEDFDPPATIGPVENEWTASQEGTGFDCLYVDEDEDLVLITEVDIAPNRCFIKNVSGEEIPARSFVKVTPLEKLPAGQWVVRGAKPGSDDDAIYVASGKDAIAEDKIGVGYWIGEVPVWVKQAPSTEIVPVQDIGPKNGEWAADGDGTGFKCVGQNEASGLVLVRIGGAAPGSTVIFRITSVSEDCCKIATATVIAASCSLRIDDDIKVHDIAGCFFGGLAREDMVGVTGIATRMKVTEQGKDLVDIGCLTDDPYAAVEYEPECLWVVINICCDGGDSEVIAMP